MDRDLIERLAREAQVFAGPTEQAPAWWQANLARFAALVAEECAKVCETQLSTVASPYDCAENIRERFKAP